MRPWPFYAASSVGTSYDLSSISVEWVPMFEALLQACELTMKYGAKYADDHNNAVDAAAAGGPEYVQSYAEPTEAWLRARGLHRANPPADFDPSKQCYFTGCIRVGGFILSASQV